METSVEIKNIAAALVKYHAKAENVTRDKTNPHFKNQYATLDNIIDTTRPLLAEVGISVIQLPVGDCGLTTMLLHESGEFIKETYTMSAKANDPQGNGSRLTYQRRYALGAILGIATEADDDGNAANKTPTPLQAHTPDVRPELIQQLNIVTDAASFNELKNRKEYWKNNLSAAESELFKAKTKELNLKWDSENKKYV